MGATTKDPLEQRMAQHERIWKLVGGYTAFTSALFLATTAVSGSYAPGPEQVRKLARQTAAERRISRPDKLRAAVCGRSPTGAQASAQHYRSPSALLGASLRGGASATCKIHYQRNL
jgi:hypothetical protein